MIQLRRGLCRDQLLNPNSIHLRRRPSRALCHNSSNNNNINISRHSINNTLITRVRIRLLQVKTGGETRWMLTIRPLRSASGTRTKLSSTVPGLKGGMTKTKDMRLHSIQ